MRGGEAHTQGTRGELRGKLVFLGVRPVPQQWETQACRPPCRADGAVLWHSVFALCTASYKFLAGDSDLSFLPVCLLLRSLFGERGLRRQQVQNSGIFLGRAFLTGILS